MRIIFCGFGRAAKECLLQLLCYEDIEKILVYTHDLPENKEFIELINNLNIEYSIKNINNNIDEIRLFRPDSLISVYYRLIIKEEILKIINSNGMNLHPSLLPDYKGCFSNVWTILNGESETGISFHYITNQVDSGNIILQEKLKIREDDTAYSLYHKLISLFIQNFKLAFEKFCDNNPGIKQDNCKTSRFYKREIPFGGVLDSKTVSYEYGKRFVRAMYFPYKTKPCARFIIDGKETEIKSLSELEKYKNKFKDSK